VLGPYLVLVGIRDEHEAKLRLIAVYRCQMLEEIFTPKFMLEKLIVEHADFAID